jgi:cytochrome c-type biogenesis protein CcmH/NrfF
VASVEASQQLGRAIAVADVSGGHVHGQQQAEGVDQQVALAAVELLGAVVAMRPPLSVVLMLWLSKTAALGVGHRPWRTRSLARSTRRMCHQRPSSRQQRK